MDCAGKQERKPNVTAVTSSVSFSPVENIWADSSFPLPSLADNGSCISTITSHQNLVGLNNPEVHALPTSCQIMVECDQPEMHSLPSSTRHDMADYMTAEAHLLPPSSAALDRAAVAHAMNPFAIQFGCLGNPVSHSNLHVVHSKVHGPSSVSLSTGEGSSLSGNTLCMSYLNVSASSGNNVAHAVSSSPCVSKVLTPRPEFMQSYVNTLLPELKSIHCHSPPMSLKEKLSAVRLAANMSLAVSAGCNNTWSQALFQELASSSSSKLKVRRKHNVRKANILKGRIYASILRRSSLRAGSHAVHLASRPQACHFKGSSSSASFSRVRDCSSSTLHLSAESSSDVSASFSGGSSDAARCKEISYFPKARHGRRSGQSSYVRVLRQSRSTEKFAASVKLPADTCNEANKAYTPSISKEHIMSLGKLVPGGRNMDVPLLFQEAAHYILSLQMQVEALQSLFHFVSL